MFKLLRLFTITIALITLLTIFFLLLLINNSKPTLPSYQSYQVTKSIYSPTPTLGSYILTYDGKDKPSYATGKANPKNSEENKYLEMWKQAFMNYNQMSNEYFNRHINPYFIEISTSEFNKGAKFFEVTYSFNVDWAYTPLNDIFIISKTGMGDSLTLDELEKDIDQPYELTKYEYTPGIRRIKKITSIASTKTLIASIKEKSNFLSFDVRLDIHLDNQGSLTMNIDGITNYEENRCIIGKVNLEDAKVSDITNSMCWIS